eukprot:s6420_g1.t4
MRMLFPQMPELWMSPPVQAFARPAGQADVECTLQVHLRHRKEGSVRTSANALGDTDEAPFSRPPLTASRLTFSLLQQPLRGAPMRQGKLWSTRFTSLSTSMASLSGTRVPRWPSPCRPSFSCGTASSRAATTPHFQIGTVFDIKIFKISLFATNGRGVPASHSACYYFGVRSTDERWAEDERSRWVLDVSRGVRLVTQSLFPP